MGRGQRQFRPCIFWVRLEILEIGRGGAAVVDGVGVEWIGVEWLGGVCGRLIYLSDEHDKEDEKDGDE